MKILGIETSCDETAAAVVEDGKKILSNVVATQIPFHKIYNGVVPEIASRKHAEWILPVAKKAVADAGLSPAEIDAVAATSKPGLVGSLLVGLTFAKSFAWALKKPFVAVNHMLGHLYASRLLEGDFNSGEKNSRKEKSTCENFENDFFCDENSCEKNSGSENFLETPYPFLALLVSGGHTIICKANDFDDLEILGTTVDDSVGEAFDKVAKFYGLGYPGGKVVEERAAAGDAGAFNFPVPKTEGEFDFSFSGLKTAVIHQKKLFLKNGFSDTIENLCAAFQEAAFRTITSRLFRACDKTGIKTVVCGGGVAANMRLRKMLSERADIKCVFPPLKLCGDNGAMIAGVAYHFLARGERSGLDTTAMARVLEFKRGAK